MMTNNVVYDKESVKSLLKEWVMVVTFEKKDGTLREMKCTLAESLLPKYEQKEKKKVENPNVLSVWDTEKETWRSFRLDSIQSLSYSSYVTN